MHSPEVAGSADDAAAVGVMDWVIIAQRIIRRHRETQRQRVEKQQRYPHTRSKSQSSQDSTRAWIRAQQELEADKDATPPKKLKTPVP